MEISRLFGGITAITIAVHMDGAEQADAVVIDQHALFNGQHPGKFTGAEKHAEFLLKKGLTMKRLHGLSSYRIEAGTSPERKREENRT